METDYKDLKLKWEQFKSYHPEFSSATAADRLGVSEVELFYSSVGENIKFLKPDFRELIPFLIGFGKLNLMVRNKSSIQQVSGVFSVNEISTDEILQIKNDLMDLEIHLAHLKYGFSIKDQTKKSFRFFDKQGQTVFEIGMSAQTDEKEFDKFVDRFKQEIKEEKIEIENIETETSAELNPTQLENFQNDWKNLEKPEDFDKILNKYGLSYWQAAHQAAEDFFSQKIKNRKIVYLLEEVSKTETEVKIVVSNHSCVQFCTGKIEKTDWHEAWFNSFGEEFNFHFDTSKIIESRIIRKPSRSGIISSVACFDTDRNLAFEIFCQTQKDEPEPNEWRVLLNEIEN